MYRSVKTKGRERMWGEDGQQNRCNMGGYTMKKHEDCMCIEEGNENERLGCFSRERA